MPHLPTALFVGRFQPFHNGHLLVVQGMAKLCGKIIIAIGSSQEKDTEKNPYSVSDRREMIQRALQAVNIIPMKDVQIIDVPDQPKDDEWTKKVLGLSGPVEMVWTGDAKTKECFVAAGVPVKDIKEVPGISGEEVRHRIKEGGNWKAIVPPDVASYIDLLKGVKENQK